MPILKSTYIPPAFIKSGHLQTIYPYLFRKSPIIEYSRERIATPDQDFLDLDWSKIGSKDLVILAHGLEGHSNRKYILWMVKYFNQKGVDTLSINFRSCSGEINLSKRFYHHDTIDDLELIISHVVNKYKYKKISLIGFSLGGSLIINYLGRKNQNLPKEIYRAVAFSTPLDLKSSSFVLKNKLLNHIYVRNFMKTLRIKMHKKNNFHNLGYDPKTINSMKDFDQFDEIFTAPIHGFKDRLDYYQKVSAKQRLPMISTPLLVINALNDPFLAPECFPFDEAKANPHVFLECPEQGGHCGFLSFKNDPFYWSEQRAGEFILQ